MPAAIRALNMYLPLRAIVIVGFVRCPVAGAEARMVYSLIRRMPGRHNFNVGRVVLVYYGKLFGHLWDTIEIYLGFHITDLRADIYPERAPLGGFGSYST